MPGIYQRPLPPTRGRADFYRHAHPVHDQLGGDLLANYQPLPRELSQYTIGKSCQLKISGQTETRSPRIIADFKGWRFTFVTDQRMVIRPAIERGEIYLAELGPKGGPAGLALMQVLDGETTLRKGEQIDECRGRISLIDYAKTEEIRTKVRGGSRNIRLIDIFPNCAILEMWGVTPSVFRGGAAITIFGQSLAFGTDEMSPFYLPAGAENIIFSGNLAGEEMSVGVIINNELRHLGTMTVRESRVYGDNGQSVEKKMSQSGYITFESLCEAAALPHPINTNNFRGLKANKLFLSFAEPPEARMLTEGTLTCRIWLGGIRVDWENKGEVRTYRAVFSANGTLIDGCGQAVIIKGKSVNIRRHSSAQMPIVNFWKLYDGSITEGIGGKSQVDLARIGQGLAGLISGSQLSEEHFNEFCSLKLGKDGRFVFEVGERKIAYTGPALKDRFPAGGEAVVAIERVRSWRAVSLRQVLNQIPEISGRIGEYFEFTSSDGKYLRLRPEIDENHIENKVKNKKQRAALLRIYRHSRAAALSVYDRETGARLTSLLFDPKEKRFCYRRRGGTINQLTYLIYHDNQTVPLELFGLKVFQNAAVVTRGSPFYLADVDLAEGGGLKSLIKIKRLDRAARAPLKPIYNDQGQPIAYCLGDRFPNKLLARINGWVVVNNWRRQPGSETIIFAFDGVKKIDQKSAAALGIKDGAPLMARVEGGQITAVAAWVNEQIANVQHLRVVRNSEGGVEKSSSGGINGVDLRPGQILTNFVTYCDRQSEYVKYGADRIIVRRRQPGEKFIVRQVSLVVGQRQADGEQTEYASALVYEAPHFPGIMQNIAIAMAKLQPRSLAEREAAEPALLQAVGLYQAGREEKEVVAHLIGQEHFLVKEAAGARTPASKKWLADQAAAAKKIRRKIWDLEKQFAAVPRSQRNGNGGLRIFSDDYKKMERILGQIRTEAEANGQQSTLISRERNRTRLAWIKLVDFIGKICFPRPIDYLVSKGELGQETVLALRFFVEHPSIFNPKGNGAFAKKVEEIKEFLRDNYPEA